MHDSFQLRDKVWILVGKRSESLLGVLHFETGSCFLFVFQKKKAENCFIIVKAYS